MRNESRNGVFSRGRRQAVRVTPNTDLALGLFEGVHGGAVHAALEAIVTIDEEQRIVMINPAALRMFGCTAAVAIGSFLSRFIPARHRAAHEAHVRRFKASDIGELSMGERAPIVGLRANGDEFPAERPSQRRRRR
jgi:PAS domain S-box-containing protein